MNAYYDFKAMLAGVQTIAAARALQECIDLSRMLTAEQKAALRADLRAREDTIAQYATAR